MTLKPRVGADLSRHLGGRCRPRSSCPKWKDKPIGSEALAAPTGTYSPLSRRSRPRAREGGEQGSCALASAKIAWQAAPGYFRQGPHQLSAGPSWPVPFASKRAVHDPGFWQHLKRCSHKPRDIHPWSGCQSVIWNRAAGKFLFAVNLPASSRLSKRTGRDRGQFIEQGSRLLFLASRQGRRYRRCPYPMFRGGTGAARFSERRGGCCRPVVAGRPRCVGTVRRDNHREILRALHLLTAVFALAAALGSHNLLAAAFIQAKTRHSV